jgi:hypothetical protein
MTRNIAFRKLQLLPSSGERRESSTLSDHSEGSNLNQNSSFRNPFSSYLEFQTTDRVYKPSDSERYTPSSESLRSHQIFFSRVCSHLQPTFSVRAKDHVTLIHHIRYNDSFGNLRIQLILRNEIR